MNYEEIFAWVEANPEWGFVGILVLSLLVYLIARLLIGRGLYYIARRTKSVSDDIIVKSLHPFRFAWIAPLLVIYSFAYMLPDYEYYIEQTILFLMLWVVVMTLTSLLDAVNNIYEHRPDFSGVSIQSYLDLVKLLFVVVGLILSISIITGESPMVLLTGLGALTAVLLLVFRDTLLSLVASVQISTNDLIKEGDWLEVPSYEADGDVLDISLHTVKIQNWNKTISFIPTHKFLEVAFKNWRGMSESGGRRIKRSISIDLSSVKMFDEEMVAGYKKIQLLKEYIEAKEQELQAYNQEHEVDDSVLVNGRRQTNVGVFRAYMSAYLHSREDIHQQDMTFLVRQLEPGPTGLPLEIYVFTKTTDWILYEGIQADIFDHLLAVLPQFGLRVFQKPTGLDFAKLAESSP
ncbi:MAG: mechanosensitive ion channel family protein [Anaerolineae bacterium]|nr:mechanosensitive ion channel family protein [Anaerolineae bacterium]